MEVFTGHEVNSRMGDQDDFNSIAMDGLANYDIDVEDVDFIRHSDNITFRVRSTGGMRYLLRIHSPLTKAMGSHGTNVRMVNSELIWLESLNKDTDLVLQQPVRNKSGALVTTVSIEGDVDVLCTLLTWIEGDSYHRDLETKSTAYQIGKILAVMHQYASERVLPINFLHPYRDTVYFKGVLKALRPAVTDKRFENSDFMELEKAVHKLIDRIDGMGGDKSFHGIIHADPHKGNMLLYNGNIRLIDFSFCAYGHFMFDLGVCLSDMKVGLHQSCLDGYRSLRSLPPDYQWWIEAFFLGSIIGTFSFWAANPQAQDLLARKAPQITRDFAMKFNREESFWF